MGKIAPQTFPTPFLFSTYVASGDGDYPGRLTVLYLPCGQIVVWVGEQDVVGSVGVEIPDTGELPPVGQRAEPQILRALAV